MKRLPSELRSTPRHSNALGDEETANAEWPDHARGWKWMHSMSINFAPAHQRHGVTVAVPSRSST